MSKVIFIDIDDTLFFTQSCVLVMNSGMCVKELNNKEFNDYELKDGESFDFSQFKCTDTFTNTSVPNKRMIDLLITLREEGNEICLLTARGDFNNKQKLISYLNQHKIDVGHYRDNKIHIIRCGNKPGQSHIRKLHKIRKFLKKRPDVTEIVMYDDHIKNLKEIMNLNVRVTLFLVDKSDIKEIL